MMADRESKPSRKRGTKYRRRIVENGRRTVELAKFVAERLRAGDVPGLVFIREKRHACLLAEAISAEAGCEAPPVTSLVSKGKRDEMSERMRKGELQVAICTDVWSTGLDIPRVLWVLMAGAGQAPAGLKQRGGRATRLFEGKDEYVLYDVVDIGPGTENYVEQAVRREGHYKRAGFKVEGSLDAERLRTLLGPQAGGRGPAPSSEPGPNQKTDWLSMSLLGTLLLAFATVATIVEHCAGS
jgi:superfamily II DNA or RNA helicase